MPPVRNETPMAAALAAQGLDWIVPEWPAPSRVHALSTTRNGAAGHAIDFAASASRVASGRELLRNFVPDDPVWLRQVHGAAIADLDEAYGGFAADGSVTRTPGTVCAVLTADCLPVLLADRDARVVAAAHAGWRGLAAGVLEAAVAKLRIDPASVLAWLGPAIRAAPVRSRERGRRRLLRSGSWRGRVLRAQYKSEHEHEHENERRHEMARRSLRAGETKASARRRKRGLWGRALHTERKRMLPFVSARWSPSEWTHGDDDLARIAMSMRPSTRNAALRRAARQGSLV